MSKLMLVVGILFAAVGTALGLMIFFSPGSVVGWGITPEVAVALLVGGALTTGLGGVIQALEASALAPQTVTQAVSPTTLGTAGVTAVIPEFGRRPADNPTESISPAVQETITALEEAKSNIRQALGETVAAPAVEPVTVPVPVEEPAPASPEAVAVAAGEPTAEEEAEPAEEDGQLYVVEERTIRNREARILSDGTVEAETDEGWMRFENLEHLDEYLDAMESSA